MMNGLKFKNKRNRNDNVAVLHTTSPRTFQRSQGEGKALLKERNCYEPKLNQEDPKGNSDFPIVERKSRIALMKKEKLVKGSVIASRFPLDNHARHFARVCFYVHYGGNVSSVYVKSRFILYWENVFFLVERSFKVFP